MADFEDTSKNIGTYTCTEGFGGEWKLASEQPIGSLSGYSGTIFPEDETLGRHLVIIADSAFYPYVSVLYDAGYENSNHYQRPELFATLWTGDEMAPKDQAMLYPNAGFTMKKLEAKGIEGVENEFHFFIRPLGDFSGMVNFSLAVGCNRW